MYVIVYDEIQASGVMTAIDYPEKLSWKYEVGYVGTTKETPLEGSELFIAASITKTFVAVCILQMEEEGKLSIHDKASNYLDGKLLKQLTTYREKSYEKELTIEHLLRHTSGIADYLNNTKTHLNGYKNTPDRIYSLQDRVEIALKDTPSTNALGKYAYSNTNYILLGMIAEAIDKVPISVIIHNRVVSPLKLKNTTLQSDENRIPQMFRAYYTDWDLTSFTYHFNQMNAAGGILTSIDDLMKFGKSLFQGKLFRSTKTLDKMLSFKKGYGLGVMQYDKSKKTGRIYGHSGFDPGYTCYLAYLEEIDTTIVTVLNQSEKAAIMPAFLLVKTVHLIKEDL